MAKYLLQVSYTAEGAKGLLKDGGTKRQAAAKTLVESLGGKIDCFYFAFGETDVVAIADFPDSVSAAAASLTISGSGAVSGRMTVLLTPEEIDQATRSRPNTRRPESSLRRAIVSAAFAIVVLVAAPVALYSFADPEKRDLDDAVRRATPGQFVRLTDGYTHYEIAGPPAGHVVVLAAGFSVPYYIWDPTFKALAEAGFRVLRYDYYGRGFSDRPDVPYTQAFYVRQLAELLDSLKSPNPIDLAGLSLGGSIVTSFADTFPDRVRSLIYVDPSFRSPGPLPAVTNPPSCGASSPPSSPNDDGPTNSSPTFCTPNAFPTGRSVTGCKCSTAASAARGCPNS